ncbi:MAG: PilZ domain-containing protein [Myxococcota bacterium]|jgi:uncharacterized protein (TIGR02266 family)|nr:PilZ domain-containing protein [Myxococcota bacterium]
MTVRWERLHRRVPFAFPVCVQHSGTNLTGFCQRVAAVGLYVYHPIRLWPEQDVLLEFSLPVLSRQPIRAQARVRRVDPLDPLLGLLGGMQILFTHLELADSLLVDRFVDGCIGREASYEEEAASPQPTPSGLPRYAVRYFGTGSSRAEYVEDISEGGVLIRTLRPLPKGTLLELELYLPGAERSLVMGNVVWSEPFSASTPGQSGMGIAFLDLPDGDRQRIADFVGTFGEHVQVCNTQRAE